MAKKQQTIEIPKAVPKKRKASKPKKVTTIAIPKAEIKPVKTAKKPKRRVGIPSTTGKQTIVTNDLDNS